MKRYPTASLASLALLAVLLAARADAAPPITVREAVGSAVIVPEDNLVDPDKPNPVSISPDGRRYALRVMRGEVERNRIRLDLLTGSLDSLEAAKPALVASLYSGGWGSETSGDHPALSNLSSPIWLDPKTIAFPWEDEKDVIQFVAVDLDSRRTRWLTRHPTDVTLAVANGQGSVLYAAQRARKDERAERIARGYAVDQADAISAIRGQSVSTLDLYYDLDLFLARPGAAPRKLDAGLRWAIIFQPLLSPDGRFALVNAWPKDLPESWRGHYRPDHAPAGLDLIGEAFKDRNSWYGRQISQLFLVDMASGAARPLWNAPTRHPRELRAAWSPDGASLAVGPGFAPPDSSDPAARLGTLIAVIDRASASYSALSLPDGVDPLKVSALRFLGNDRLSIEAGGKAYLFARQGGDWRLTEGANQVAGQAPSPIGIEQREALNEPPRLVAVERASGREAVLLDVNPGLATRHALGKVEAIRIPDRDGRQWSALLYHPVGEQPGRRYPLVIQAHGHAPADSFSLYGLGFGAPGTGPSWSVYAAQPLAGRGIAVLQMEDKREAGTSQTPREPEMYMRAFEAAVDYLDAKGLIDPARVGLSGFSRSGWHIEYAITHSDRVFAAALSSDNLAASYVEDVLTPGNLDRENGGAPFGAGLASWLETSPAFSAERVRTPLRAQLESGGLPGILFKWELFSRLRRLGAPVELTLVPQIDRGSHTLLNPGQVIAVKEGAVDWFDFWLNGHEDPDPAKAEQYGRWRQLREKRDALAKLPRPPLLEWKASPRVPEQPADKPD